MSSLRYFVVLAIGTNFKIDVPYNIYIMYSEGR